MNDVSVLAIVFVGVVSTAWWVRAQRIHGRKAIRCPLDGMPRLVEFRGDRRTRGHWTDVTECGVPGWTPLKGPEVRCSKPCLKEIFSPERDLKPGRKL